MGTQRVGATLLVKQLISAGAGNRTQTSYAMFFPSNSSYSRASEPLILGSEGWAWGSLSHQQSPTGGTRHPPWSSSILPRKGFLRGPNTMQCACPLIFHRRQGQTVRLFLSKPHHTPGTGGRDSHSPSKC